jgi:ribonucleoside-diphosphate reductase alpha chain
MYHPLYEEWLRGQSVKSKEKNNGASGGLEDQKSEKPDYFVVADDLTPLEHVQIQALIQKYTDSSISKTVNAPKSHTVADVKELYERAYALGCKGVSYFRDGSREATLVREDLKQTDAEESKAVKSDRPEDHMIKERPLKVMGATYKMKTPVGTAFVTVNHDDDGAPFEVFLTVGKAGSEVAAMADALGRLISTSLRFGGGMTAKERAIALVEQLQGIRGSQPVGFGINKVMSLPDAVAKALSMDLGLIGSAANGAPRSVNGQSRLPLPEAATEQLSLDETGAAQAVAMHVMKSAPADICKECGNAALVREEGCHKCYSCGYSEC